MNSIDNLIAIILLLEVNKLTNKEGKTYKFFWHALMSVEVCQVLVQHGVSI